MSGKVWCLISTDEDGGQCCLGCYMQEAEADKALAYWMTTELDDYCWVEEYSLHNKFKEPK